MSASGTIWPLIAATEPNPEEGFHALLARATHRNRLGHSKVILSSLGLDLHQTGIASRLVDETKVTHLAAMLGCDREQVFAKCNVPADAGSSDLVRWGTTYVRRSDILWTRRRICPALLERQDWLPAQWSLKDLLLCGDCFRPLVDRCPECRRNLGWGEARGVARCGSGKHTPAITKGQPLGLEFRGDYGFLYSLCSMDQDVRRAAFELLPDAIADLALYQILDLAFGLGQCLTLGSNALKRVGTDNPPLLTAETYARGISVLRGWPTALVELGETFVAQGRAHEEHFWAMLDLLSRRSSAASQTRAFVRQALPGLFDDRRRSVPALLQSTMGTRELQIASGLMPAQMQAIRKAGAFGKVHETGRTATSFQIDRVVGDEIVQIRRAFKPIHSTADRLGLTVYSLEQMCCLNLLEHRDHKALVALHERPRVAEESVTDFLAQLKAKCSAEAGSRVRLRAVCAALYQGEKPYAQIIQLILDGALDAHLSPDEHKRSHALLSRILVAPADLMALKILPFDRSVFPSFRFSATDVQRDAADVLSVRNVDIQQAVGAELLHPTDGRNGARSYDRAEVRAAAERHITSTALVHRLRMKSLHQVNSWCRQHGIERTPLGWSRRQVGDATSFQGN